ncbi:hypothetical protein D3OALGA1CA_1358 [Olavius algarvensis associated proteobacterium Delta 3]|nr:hypothetical protein D3OALGA1CA_1358 [Olavius algarvensis associated proteobacterium Delta 3]CAB5124328.1 hypothetical protein D3OALGB2SA_3179 [Olavius algarvensis associated proteobacterium Delta 3]
MEVQNDFKELLELFNVHHVEYVIVGGYALAFHGAPRFTGDLDIYVRPDPENAARIMEALSNFGFGDVGIHNVDFEETGKVIQLGVPPVRIDIVTSLTGITWEDVSSDRVAGVYGSVPVHYIGRDPFVRNKKALARYKDLADLEALGEKTY